MMAYLIGLSFARSQTKGNTAKASNAKTKIAYTMYSVLNSRKLESGSFISSKTAAKNKVDTVNEVRAVDCTMLFFETSLFINRKKAVSIP